MDHVTKVFQAEDYTDTDKLRMGIASTVTSAGTLALTRTSTCHQAFTGTTAGQIVQLPNATTLIAGWTFFLWNEATQSIAVKDNGSNLLLNVPAKFNCIIVLRDASTTNGLWSLTRSSPSSGGSGVTPPFIFSKSGGAGVGSYLKTGEVLTSNTGQFIKGINYIVELKASNSVNQTNAGGCTFQFQRRTGVSTFVNITGATVNIPNGQYEGSNTGLSISLGPDWEISVYNSGPGNASDAVVVMYLEPQ